MPIAQSNVRRPDILFESVLGTGTDVFFSCEISWCSGAELCGAATDDGPTRLIVGDGSSGMAF